jgi:hypothetical protein
MGPLAQVFIAKKNIGIAYLLWFFFAYLGAHKFYLGRPLMGLVYIGLFLFSVVGTVELAQGIRSAILLSIEDTTTLFPFGAQPSIGLLGMKYLGMVGLGFAYFYDLVTLPWQVNDANARALAKAQQTAGGALTGSGSRRDDDEGLAAKRADELIARYLAQQAQSAMAQKTGPTNTGSAPTFGKRR